MKKLFFLIFVLTFVALSKENPRRPALCYRPPPRSEGMCTIGIEGYYYDNRTNDCEHYEVGGCRSIPGQSFGSKDDCLETCKYMRRNIERNYASKK